METESQDITKAMSSIIDISRTQLATNQELLWAEIFNSTIRGSKWFTENTSLSLGRAAIGYNCAYPLYRILDEIHPHSILEMGLGQSTKIISKYIEYYSKNTTEEYEHSIVEHNEEWIDFFTKSHTLPSSTHIVHLNAVHTIFENLQPDIPKADVLRYEHFRNHFQNKKYDLIFIDGPNGSLEFSRIDILDILPECLEKSFIIMLDDYERIGEQRTAHFIHRVLYNNNISAYEGVYSGLKSTGIIVSEDLKFLCTL